MSRRVMVTGAGGFVAGAIVHQADAEWEVHAITRKEPLLQRPGLAWHILDLTDSERLREEFERIAPDAVIHAAAIADIDFCEANREKAQRVNTGVTQGLICLCNAAGARFVFLSTDNVFDGNKGNYTEEDPPSPLSWYGATKVEAEHLVTDSCANGIVVRVSVVMGLPMLGAGNSFLSRMIPVLEAGKELGVPDNEIRSPIDIITAARALLELAGNNLTGCLHLAGNDILNRYEMAKRLATRLGYNPNLVVARDPTYIAGRAARPLDASLCNKKARSVLHTPMQGLEEGLELVLAEKKGIPA